MWLISFHFDIIAYCCNQFQKCKLEGETFSPDGFSPCWNSAFLKYKLLLPICICLWSCLRNNFRAISKGEKKRVVGKPSSVPLSSVQFILIAYSVMTPIIHWRERCKGQTQQIEIGFWKGWMRLARNLFRSKADKSSSSLVLYFILPLVDAVFCYNLNTFWLQSFCTFPVVRCPSITQETKIKRSLTAVLISLEKKEFVLHCTKKQ